MNLSAQTLRPHMKKFALFWLAGALLSFRHQAFAQAISIAASPASESVAAGSSFNISLTLSVPQGSGPSNVTAYDLYLVTAATNSAYFSITAVNPTGPFNTLGPDDTNGDPLKIAAGSGYVRNGIDQGFSGTAQTVPFSNLALETLTLAVAANTPANTYIFQTSTMATAGVYYSDVSDSGGKVYEVTSAGTFSISVVPEPSSLATFGAFTIGLICFAASRYRWSISPQMVTNDQISTLAAD